MKEKAEKDKSVNQDQKTRKIKKDTREEMRLSLNTKNFFIIFHKRNFPLLKLYNFKSQLICTLRITTGFTWQ